MCAGQQIRKAEDGALIIPPHLHLAMLDCLAEDPSFTLEVE